MTKNCGRDLRQERLIEVWLRHPAARYGDIAEEAGVSESTFLRWRHDPEFMEKYHAACTERFGALEAAAME